MTLLAVSISGDTEDDIRQNIVDAVEQGAELLEFRIDLMPGISDDSIRTLRQSVPDNFPCILTIRHSSEGGNYDGGEDRKSTRLNSSHVSISYAVFCLKKKKTHPTAPHAIQEAT